MSYQVGSACYATAQEAAQVSASSQLGSIIQDGIYSYVVDAASVSGTSIQYQLTTVGSGISHSVTSSYTAQPCNLLQAADALTIGWGVVGAWIAAFALLFITRALRGETGDNYGNS